MRCDLHVHSFASGMFTAPGLNRFCRESYNEPAEVYERLKHLGMSIVTITDHDSIDAVEVLRRYPDFFLSEEVSVQMPSGTEMHLGVYGIAERDHAEIQQRRNDFISLLMYLMERKLFCSVNHVFSGLTGPRHEDDFHWFASHVPAFETRNGSPNGLERLPSPAAIRTPLPASAAPSPKFPARETPRNSCPGCARETALFTAPTAATARLPPTCIASCAPCCKRNLGPFR